jgi:hypothetical protein
MDDAGAAHRSKATMQVGDAVAVAGTDVLQIESAPVVFHDENKCPIIPLEPKAHFSSRGMLHGIV